MQHCCVHGLLVGGCSTPGTLWCVLDTGKGVSPRPAFPCGFPTSSDEVYCSLLQQLPFARAALPMFTRVAAKCCVPNPWLGGVILNYEVFPIYYLFNHCKSKLVLLFLWCFIQLIIINTAITKSKGSDSKGLFSIDLTSAFCGLGGWPGERQKNQLWLTWQELREALYGGVIKKVLNRSSQAQLPFIPVIICEEHFSSWSPPVNLLLKLWELAWQEEDVDGCISRGVMTLRMGTEKSPCY